MTERLDIRLKEIEKVYDRKRVLKGCSHLFDHGMVHALIGPNGSGKSTLLRICGLIEAPDRGAVKLGDIAAEDRNGLSLRRKVTMVFSKGGLFNASVADNAAYGLVVRGVEQEKRNALVEEVLVKVGLWEKRKQNAKTLSAGEGQRLAIARAIVFEPEVILLDEPTASLDPANTVIVEKLIQDLIKRKEKTVVMATHNLFQAQRLSDRIVFMHDGNLYDEGETKMFFENPKHEIALKFITGKLIY